MWAVVPEAVDVPNYYAMPNTAGGTFLVGGPSNAGGLFLNWATALLGDGAERGRSGAVPVWVPYPRGERVPLQDPDRRGQLVDLDLTARSRGAPGRFEATGVRARRMIEASPVPAAHRRDRRRHAARRVGRGARRLHRAPGARVRGSRRRRARRGVPGPARRAGSRRR